MADRPGMSEVSSSRELMTWYWLKEELVAYCELANLPANGSKQTILDRIAYALDHEGALLPSAPKPRPTSRFNWAREDLSPDTVITDSVTFGPNFRRYMKSRIGKKFTCHSDFMDWVLENTGKTLLDAEEEWQRLEDRKKDPEFRRSIARQNMMAQYVRDFLEAHPELGFNDAVRVWSWKKRRPMKQGRVLYEKSDILGTGGAGNN